MKTRNFIATAGLIGLGMLMGCAKPAPKVQPAKPVKTKAVESRSIASTVRYSASIRPSAQVDVAFKVSGYVDSIARENDPAGQSRSIQAGDIVSRGAVLAQVRQNDYLARVNEARSQQGEARSALETNKAQVKESTAAIETNRAQISDAQATFDRAKQDLARAQTLYASQSMTRSDFDAAKAQYESAQAKLETAKGNLRSAEARLVIARTQIGAAESRIRTAEAATVSATIPLQDTQLHAPLSGVVIERRVEVGSLVSQGVTGFVLADLTEVKAAFGVPDLALQSLKLGDTLSVTSDAVPGTEFSGHISRISPSADQNSRVFDVEVTIPNEQFLLKPGMIATVSVGERSGGRIERPVVPLTSITKAKIDPNAYAVFVIEEREGKRFARQRNVMLGEPLGNDVAISNGLKPGEYVVTTGATQVSDGDEVTLIP